MTLIIRNDNYEWLSNRVYYSVVESQKYFNTKFMLDIQFIANHKINCLKRNFSFKELAQYVSTRTKIYPLPV